jgi:apolipoprotein N-acyltransferase
MKSNKVTIFQLFLAIFATGAGVFLSNGIYFIWPLAWLSAIPILVILPRVKLVYSFLSAFVAYSLGFSVHVLMLRNTIPVPMAIISFMAYALIYSVAFLITGCLTSRINHHIAVFIFPTAWTVIEYLLYTSNPNGTWGSSAYTQTSFLPIAQVASITGIWGIVFLQSLFSSWMSFLWNYRSDKRYLLEISAIPFGLVVIALCFGFIRLSQKPVENTVQVGIIATDDDIRFFKTEGAEEALPIIEAYAKKIDSLALQGADVVVLPEKVVGITDEYSNEAEEMFSKAARDNQLTIIAGVNILGSTPWKNRAWVFTPDGQLAIEYDKRYLVQGWESGKYEVGEKLGIFRSNQSLWGVLICKDNDFPSYARLYGKQGIELMLSPA